MIILIVNCVPLFDAPLTKIRDNFLAIGPFFMFLGAFERHGHAAHYAFNFIEKYLFFEKLQLIYYPSRKKMMQLFKIQNVGDFRPKCWLHSPRSIWVLVVFSDQIWIRVWEGFGGHFRLSGGKKCHFTGCIIANELLLTHWHNYEIQVDINH